MGNIAPTLVVSDRRAISIPTRVCFLFAVCSRRSCSDRAVKLEASVETYRRKLEDLGDLRRQVKQLEEKAGNVPVLERRVLRLEAELCYYR